VLTYYTAMHLDLRPNPNAELNVGLKT